MFDKPEIVTTDIPVWLYEAGISKRIELQLEKSGEYIFDMPEKQIDSNTKSGIEELGFEDSGIMAVIRYQVKYSEMKNLMYDMQGSI